MNSIDKFGRHLSQNKVKGPPGEGFKLTSEGNYDMDNKLLVNVANPVNSKDVVNMETLQSEIEPCLKLNKTKRKYDTLGLGITIPTPSANDDAVNLDYLKNYLLIDDVIDAKKRKITNVQPGSSPSDVVTNSQLPKDRWDFENRKITNVKAAENVSDVVTYGQVKDMCLVKREDNKFDVKGSRIVNLPIPKHFRDAVPKHYVDEFALTSVAFGSVWDAKGKPIKNVGKPAQYNDAVTLEYLKANSLTKDYDKMWFWDAKDMFITNVKDPEKITDAVNINYLIRVLSEIIYSIYYKLTPQLDPIKKMKKDDWIKSNIVDPFFINETTKIRSSSL